MRFFKQFLRILIFFPSITFNLLQAEVFPWAFIYSFKTKINIKRGIPLLLLLFISAFISTFYSLYEGLDSDALRSLIAYLNPLMIFLILTSRSGLEEITKFQKLLNYVLITFIVVGVLQILGVISFLEPIFRLLLTRGSTDAFGLGRGVSLLSSEPSRAAYEVIFVYISWLYIQSYSKKKQLIFDFLILIFLALVIRSSMGIMIFGLYLLLKYRLKFVLLVTLIPLVMLPFLEGSSTRAIQLIYSIAQSSDLEGIFNLLVHQSGFRLVSLIASYKYAFYNPLGGGVGLWMNSSLSALSATGFDPSQMSYFIMNGGGAFTPVRPTSYLASIALDLGLLGICAMVYLLKPLIVLLKNKNSEIFPVVGIFIFSILFSGAVGNPISWVCVALCYHKYTTNMSLLAK